MPEPDISKDFKKRISLKEFELTNTSCAGGAYSKGFDVKEAAKTLDVRVSGNKTNILKKYFTENVNKSRW